mmetsp:Transcript_18288/g.20580  ORF Transcript_18288/g.20580 Transcript_18288/m.20580 type:complete len:256 (+) Transcript_18288:61-828(+)
MAQEITDMGWTVLMLTGELLNGNSIKSAHTDISQSRALSDMSNATKCGMMDLSQTMSIMACDWDGSKGVNDQVSLKNNPTTERRVKIAEGEHSEYTSEEGQLKSVRSFDTVPTTISTEKRNVSRGRSSNSEGNNIRKAKSFDGQSVAKSERSRKSKIGARNRNVVCNEGNRIRKTQGPSARSVGTTSRKRKNQKKNSSNPSVGSLSRKNRNKKRPDQNAQPIRRKAGGVLAPKSNIFVMNTESNQVIKTRVNRRQ